MTVTKIPATWTQAEINEYFNIRLHTIEKYMPLLLIGFENSVPSEDEIRKSSLKKQIQDEMIAALEEIKTKIKPKGGKG